MLEPEATELNQEPAIANTAENSTTDAETTLSTDELEADLAIAELLDEQNISVDIGNNQVVFFAF